MAWGIGQGPDRILPPARSGRGRPPTSPGFRANSPEPTTAETIGIQRRATVVNLIGPGHINERHPPAVRIVPTLPPARGRPSRRVWWADYTGCPAGSSDPALVVRRAIAAIALTTAVGLGVPVLVGTPAQAASSRPKPPLCQPLRNHADTQAWFDVHSEHSGLVRGIERLICSAAPNSTIDVKSWFLSPGDSATNTMLHELRIEHSRRGVKVNVLLGGNAYSSHPTLRWSKTINALRPFATVYSCSGGCRAARQPGLPQIGRSHAKWLTVSNTLWGQPATVSMSANWSPSSWAGEDNSGLYVPGRAIYNAYAVRWQSLVACAVSSCSRDSRSPLVDQNGVYYDTSSALWSGRSGPTSVWFDPQPTSPVTRLLSQVNCRPGNQIVVANAFAADSDVNAQLDRLRQEGCSVTVLLTWWPGRPLLDAQLDELDTTCLARHVQHDKFILLSTYTTHEVIAGSEDLAGVTSWRASDQQEMVTTDPSVYDSYSAYFARIRTGATTCTTQNIRPTVSGSHSVT